MLLHDPPVILLSIFQSVVADGPAGQHLAKFWRKVCPVNCLKSHVKTVFLQEFRGEQSEFEFIEFIARSAQKLKVLVVVLTQEKFASADEADRLILQVEGSQLHTVGLDGVVLVVGPTLRSVWKWSFRRASDLTVDDPFDS